MTASKMFQTFRNRLNKAATETQEKAQIQQGLLELGYRQAPITQTFKNGSVVMRSYLWVDTPIGDVALIAGPSIKGVLHSVLAVTRAPNLEEVEVYIPPQGRHSGYAAFKDEYNTADYFDETHDEGYKEQAAYGSREYARPVRANKAERTAQNQAALTYYGQRPLPGMANIPWEPSARGNPPPRRGPPSLAKLAAAYATSATPEEEDSSDDIQVQARVPRPLTSAREERGPVSDRDVGCPSAHRGALFGQLYDSNGHKYQTLYRVITTQLDGAGPLVASSRPNFSPSPGYPPEFQTRNFMKPAEQVKIERMAQLLDPNRLLLPHADPTFGAPVVWEGNGEQGTRPGSYYVLGGNSRTLALLRASPEVYANYALDAKRLWPDVWPSEAAPPGYRHVLVRQVYPASCPSMQDALALNKLCQMDFYAAQGLAGATQQSTAGEEDPLGQALSLVRGLGIPQANLGRVLRTFRWTGIIDRNTVGSFVRENTAFTDALRALLGPERFNTATGRAENAVRTYNSVLVGFLPRPIVEDGFVSDRQERAIIGALPAMVTLQIGVEDGEIPTSWNLLPHMEQAKAFAEMMKGKTYSAVAQALEGSFRQLGLFGSGQEVGLLRTIDPLAVLLGMVFFRAEELRDPLDAVDKTIVPYVDQAQKILGTYKVAGDKQTGMFGRSHAKPDMPPGEAVRTLGSLVEAVVPPGSRDAWAAVIAQLVEKAAKAERREGGPVVEVAQEVTEPVVEPVVEAPRVVEAPVVEAPKPGAKPKGVTHPLDRARRHQLLPLTVAKTLPPIGAQENAADPIAYVKLFSPYSQFVAYLTEYDPETQEAFGWADHGMGHGELGYISLEELASAERNGLPLIERDMYWPARPLSEAKQDREPKKAAKTPASLPQAPASLPQTLVNLVLMRSDLPRAAGFQGLAEQNDLGTRNKARTEIEALEQALEQARNANGSAGLTAEDRRMVADAEAVLEQMRERFDLAVTKANMWKRWVEAYAGLYSDLRYQLPRLGTTKESALRVLEEYNAKQNTLYAPQKEELRTVSQLPGYAAFPPEYKTPMDLKAEFDKLFADVRKGHMEQFEGPPPYVVPPEWLPEGAQRGDAIAAIETRKDGTFDVVFAYADSEEGRFSPRISPTYPVRSFKTIGGAQRAVAKYLTERQASKQERTAPARDQAPMAVQPSEEQEKTYAGTAKDALIHVYEILFMAVADANDNEESDYRFDLDFSGRGGPVTDNKLWVIINASKKTNKKAIRRLLEVSGKAEGARNFSVTVARPFPDQQPPVYAAQASLVDTPAVIERIQEEVTKKMEGLARIAFQPPANPFIEEDRPFEVGERVWFEGVMGPEQVNYRGTQGDQAIIVMSNGIQIPVPLTKLSREKPVGKPSEDDALAAELLRQAGAAPAAPKASSGMGSKAARVAAMLGEQATPAPMAEGAPLYAEPPAEWAMAPKLDDWRIQASGPTLATMENSIAAFYAGERKQLIPVGPKLWAVAGPRGVLEKVRVRKGKDRYFFESIIPQPTAPATPAPAPMPPAPVPAPAAAAPMLSADQLQALLESFDKAAREAVKELT